MYKVLKKKKDVPRETDLENVWWTQNVVQNLLHRFHKIQIIGNTGFYFIIDLNLLILVQSYKTLIDNVKIL